MKLSLNNPPKSIKISKIEITELWQYLTKCDREAFSGIHRYHFAKERELLYQWHLREICAKVHALLIKTFHYQNSKVTTIKVNEVGQHVLSVMFKRVDCTPYMLQIQTRFAKGLIKLN